MRNPIRPGRPRPVTPGASLLARRLLALSAATAAVSLLAACAGGSSGAGGGTSAAPVAAGPGGTVTVRSIDDVDTFNPATTAAPNMSVQAIELTYDRLLYLERGWQLEPYLATSWKTTPDGAVLHIRKGVTCSDGSPMTPSVIADSLRYAFSPSTHGPYTSYVTGTAGAKSVTADDAAGTVTITLKAPYNALLTALATPYVGSIICHAGVAHPASLNAAPDGSGPYVLDKSRSVRGSTYVFTLRKDYNWGPGGWSAKAAGVPDTIIDRVITDDTTAANLLTTGQVDRRADLRDQREAHRGEPRGVELHHAGAAAELGRGVQPASRGPAPTLRCGTPSTWPCRARPWSRRRSPAWASSSARSPPPTCSATTRTSAG